MNSRTADQNLSWYRGFIQGKTRIILAWVFVLLLIFFAKHYPTWPGMVLCGIGAVLRFWASGYLRKDTRPAVGGPYAFVRNPLYLGTYLMAVGTALSVDNGWLLGSATFVFAGIYHFIILDEEVKLQKIFKQPYRDYCRKVPRFFPRIWPPCFPASEQALLKINPERSHLRFSWSLAMKNKAYEAFASFLGLMAFVSVMAYLWQNFSI